MPLIRSAGFAVAALTFLAATGCSAVEQATEKVTSEAAERAIAESIGPVLERVGVKLDGTPTCTTDLDAVDGESVLAGTVSCTGKTTKTEPVKATFDGRLTVSSCTGSLSVSVGGKEVVSTPDLPACSLG
jgi:hypothetical protein